MTWDDSNVGQDVFFVDINTNAVTYSAEIIAFPRGGEPLDLAFTNLDLAIPNVDLLLKAEESLSRAVEMSSDFSGLYRKIEAAFDDGDLNSMENLRGQLLAMRDRHGFTNSKSLG